MVTFRIETTNRWDAMALARSLTGYRWYLIEPDARHWDVCVPVDEPAELPEDLCRRIEAWLCERHLHEATVRGPGPSRRLTAPGR